VKRLLPILVLLALAACAATPAAPPSPAVLATAAQTLDESVTALTQNIAALKAENPAQAPAIEAATAGPLQDVRDAAASYQAATQTGQSAKTTDTLWDIAKHAMGQVIDAAIPVVGHAALCALGLVNGS